MPFEFNLSGLQFHLSKLRQQINKLWGLTDSRSSLIKKLEYLWYRHNITGYRGGGAKGMGLAQLIKYLPGFTGDCDVQHQTTYRLGWGT